MRCGVGTWERVRSGASSPENREILFLKMLHFGAFLYALNVLQLEGFQ